MLTMLIILLAVITPMAVMAVLGGRIGARMEEPHLAAGELEKSMRRKLEPSVLGALMGITPFVIFLIWLVIEVMNLPPEAPPAGRESSSSSGH